MHRWLLVIALVRCSTQASEPDGPRGKSDRTGTSAEASRDASSAAQSAPVVSASGAPGLGRYEDPDGRFSVALGAPWVIEIEKDSNGRIVVATDGDRFIEVIATPAAAATEGDAALGGKVLEAARSHGLKVPDIGPIALPQSLDGHDGRQLTFTIAPSDRLDAISARVGPTRFILLAHGKGAFQAGREGFKIRGS